MSIKEIKQLANINDNPIIYSDCIRYNKERFLYEELEKLQLSQEGKLILENATNLVKESFKYRKEFDEFYPKYNLNTWDAGWYQIRFMLMKYMKKELELFDEMIKNLENKMRGIVYEVGFLK